jgi:hypothetical protein
MEYDVATIVSVPLCALLIGGLSVQTRYAHQRDAALAAKVSALNIQQLTAGFWECQPKSLKELGWPNVAYKRDSAYCAFVDSAMERRVNEVPALEVVNIQPPEILIPSPEMEYNATRS